MVEDVYEPVELYRDRFREEFKANAEKAFAELVERSGVDVDANARTVGEIRAKEKELERELSQRAKFRFLIWLSAIAIVALCVFGYFMYSEDGLDDALGPLLASAGGVAGLFLLIFKTLRPACRRHDAAAAEAQAHIDTLKSVAYGQMAGLNSLYEWDTVAKVVEATVPRIQFDPFFTEGRLRDLRRSYGWSDSFNDGKSVIFSQSGEINGNPFVFGQLLEMEWGTKSYTGTRTVSWTEVVRDAKGNSHVVTRYQTLVGRVYKPIPEYSQDKVLIYGNDAAPDLTFSRAPTGLADKDAKSRAVKREIRRLEKFSRNLEDESQFTMMGNKEFEALFHAVDRNDEIQFRMLFTPLAQRQMLLLLRDREVGFGDDFVFRKHHRINLIRPDHLRDADIDTNPEKFADYDFAAAKVNFIAFCEKYFKDVYFALAPLLTIPLYQQTRTHEDFYRDRSALDSAFWEHESIANYLGEDRFRHPESVTRNILKTRVDGRESDVATISVTAHGFRTEPRVDVVRVVARNGRAYDVDVPWDEYIAVSRTTRMHAADHTGLSKTAYAAELQDNETWQRFFRSWNSSQEDAAFRRSIISF